MELPFPSSSVPRGQGMDKRGRSKAQPTVLDIRERNSSSFKKCKTKLSFRDLISLKKVSFLPYL